MFQWLIGPRKAGAASSERFGRYAVQRTIHDGEKSVVYAATALISRTPVAIKAYKPLYNRTARRMRRKYHLPTEGEIGMLMNARAGDDPGTHPIVRTLEYGHEFGKARNPHFVVLEYIDGAKLKSIITTGDASLRSMRLHFCRRAARAIEVVHSRDMVHRDICGDNFLVTGMGQLKLIDLGFCVPVGLRFEEKSGTPSYMAPEQIWGEPLGPATDIYALGALMFEIFTGRLPFTSTIRGHGGHVPQGRASDILSQHLRKVPPRPTEFAPDLNPRIEQLILKCLEKRPKRRFQSVSELIHELGLLRE